MFNIKRTDPFPIDPEKGTKSKGIVPRKEPKKAFSEVMRKGEQEPEQQEQQFFGVKSEKTAETAALEATPRQKTSSYFDLPEEELVVRSFPEELKESSLSALFKGYGTREAFFKEEPIALKPKTKVDFPEESVEITSFNPMPQKQVGTVLIQNEPLAPVTRIKEIQEIVDQIVENIYTVKVEGKTDTVITLKHPPLFSNAKVVVTEFESAKKEFNVSFENLTQEAKKVLDLNQDQLKLGMERKGFTLHILTTTTLVEQAAVFKESAFARGDQQRGDQQRGDQQQEGRNPKQQKEEEKER